MLKIIENVRSPFRDRTFLSKASMIALPVAMQQLLNSLVNMIDNLMIGQLGEVPIAAVGLANKVFFVFTLLVFGCCSGAGVLAAQFWGRQDKLNIRRVLGISLIIGIIGSLLFAIPSVLIPEKVMRIFTPSRDAITIGAQYLAIAALSYPFTAISQVYVAMLRSVEQAKLPVFTSCVAIVINVIANYILIFGKFGAPALGVAGAAYGTLIARICECLVLLIVIYGRKLVLAANIKELFTGYPKSLLREYVKTSSPVIANEFMWGLGTTIYFLAYGRMGDQAVAAITLSTTVQDLFLVFFAGLSSATAIILGHELGAGHLDLARKDAKLFLWLQFDMVLVLGTMLYLLRWKFIGLFDISPEVAELVSKCIIVFILAMPAKMFNYVNIVGILRSGGDTKACFLLDTVSVWAVGIPMAFLGALALKLPVHIVYGMVMLEEVMKLIFGYFRYKKEIWVKNLAILVSEDKVC